MPIDLTHAPSPAKPGKRASEDAWKEYREQQKVMKVSSVGASRLTELREQLDRDGVGRRLVVSVDGGFTNRTVFCNLPHNTVAIGRIRKDAKLFLPPVEETIPRRGRRRWYGAALPTPEQILRDDSIPWLTVSAFAAGKTHSFEVKTIAPVRWLGTGAADTTSMRGRWQGRTGFIREVLAISGLLCVQIAKVKKGDIRSSGYALFFIEFFS